MRGHGEKLTRKHEQAIAALLSCSTVEEAAGKVGVSYSTLKRWMHDPAFAAAYRNARRELLDVSVGRVQAATGTAVDTLLAVAKNGAKDADRVRAAVALLDHALRGLTDADVLHGEQEASDDSPMDAGDLMKLLATRLRQIDESEMSPCEKARLTATLTDSLLRAIATEVLDKRLEALQAVLIGRKGNS